MNCLYILVLGRDAGRNVGLPLKQWRYQLLRMAYRCCAGADSAAAPAAAIPAKGPGRERGQP